METNESLIKSTVDYNHGYENGYHSKDYTWEDGIKYVNPAYTSESDDYRNGFAKGQRDRLLDELEKWMS